MNLLTATRATQGDRDNDYCWTVEGELLTFGLSCDDVPDGPCGCGRGFAGMSSHRATTTARVRDLPLTRQDVVVALRGYLETAGWGTAAPGDLEREADDLIALAASLPTGGIVELRGEVLQLRRTDTHH